MAAITAKMVSDLRAKTGCGMMECKKALTETNGDFDEAVKLLRERGLAVATKKASRIASEGVVDILVSDDKRSAAMIEVNAETDFVAKNALFLEFVQGILKTILETRPASVEELLTKKYDDSFTVEEKRIEMVQTIGENMNIRRFVIVDGILSTYIHGKGTTGVIVKFNTDDEAVADTAEFAEFARNIALQVAGMPVPYLNRESVPADVLEEEKGIILAQLKNDPKNASKPEQILEKMIVGKIGKFFEKNCLIEQPYVKEDKMTVGQYVDATAKALGTKIEIVEFVMFEKGEGLQKREENFADEIEKLVNGN